METLEFYGGVNEIGGNKIKLNLDSTSLLLDFGMSFSQAGKYFAEFMTPRKGNGLGDYMEMGLLPDIKGIYREDYLKHKGILFDKEPAVDGLLLSHAHADHADYIGFLRTDIPLYMSSFSEIILKVIDATGSGSKEILSYKPTFEYYLNRDKKYSDRKHKKEDPISRDVRILEPYKPEPINDLDVQLAPVDHSLPGAAAYLVEGKEERVVYTGDLRFHGRNRESTDAFVEKAKKFSPSIMVCEGTRIDSAENNKCEEDIKDNALESISNFNGLVIVNFPLRDLDRLITFYELAKSTDRTLLIKLNQAYMLYLIEKECNEGNIYPTLNDGHIGIYIPRKGNGVYPPDTFALLGDKWEHADMETAKKEYDMWERKFMDCPNVVNSMDIKGNEEQYIIRLDNFSFKELIDIKPEPGKAMYIHSVTEPFNEEMLSDRQITKNWLDHFKILYDESFDDLYNNPFHVSGHASGNDLLKMIREISPDVLYPIHTEHGDLFDVLEDDGITVIHPKNLNGNF